MSDIDISLGILGDNIVIGAFRRIGEVAIDALGSAFSAVADFAVDSFKGAIEAQEGIDKLTGSIARLGDKSPITIDGADSRMSFTKRVRFASQPLVSNSAR